MDSSEVLFRSNPWQTKSKSENMRKQESEKKSGSSERKNLSILMGFHDRYSISNGLPERISAKQIPDTRLHELSLRFAL